MASLAAALSSDKPELILHNGNILTLDRHFSVASALAIGGDRILTVGSDTDVLATREPHTRCLDLGGRTVTPGLIDTHAHMDREGLRRAYPDLQACRSIADIQSLLRTVVADKKPGEWIVLLPPGEPPFHLAPERSLEEERFPDRLELDAAAPNNPVWLRSIWGLWNNTPPFVHVLNSAGLAACNITRDTPPPTSTVEIQRDPASGELTGRILEWHLWPAAEFTILRAAPRFSAHVRREALRDAMQRSATAGTTSVFEGHGCAAEVLAAYRALHDAGEQTVRAYLPLSLPPWRDVAEAEQAIGDWAPVTSAPGFGDDWLKLGGLYFEYGGHPETAAACRSAWPYTGWAGFVEQYNTPDDYRRLCRAAARHRQRVATVILTTIDPVLSIWEDVDREFPIRDLRWVLVHGRDMLPARDFERIKRLGAVVTTQPSSYVYRSGLALLEGGADEDCLMAHADYVAAGIPWALSTDNKPYALLFTLWVAVTRRAMGSERVVSPRQRVAVPDALRALTSAGAYVCFEEHVKGSLEVGKLADLIVLSDDPLRVDPDQLKDLRVELTLVGGRNVHSLQRDWDA